MTRPTDSDRGRSLMGAPRLLVEVALAILAGILCLALSGYFSVNTALPGNLNGDHIVALIQAKGYVNGHGFRLDSQLGYPLAMDRLYFPNFDKSYQVFMWLVARIVHNPFRVIHALYMACLLLMTVFGYWILRRIGVRTWLAGVGAIAAVLTPFMLRRSYGHDYLALAISVPLGFGLALRLGAGDPEDDLRRFFRDPLTLISIAVVGFSGLYYAFYTVMLASFVAVAASLGQRRWFPLVAWGAMSVAIFVLLIFAGYGLHLPEVLAGHFPQVQRQASDQLFYGIDFPALAEAFQFIPRIARGLAQAKVALPEAFAQEGIGEWPGAPLTLAILAAPLIAATALAQRGPLPEKAKLLATTATCLCFAVLFGVRGGIGFLFNLAVSPQIRGDSRLMPFLAFGGVIILCILAELAASASRRIGSLAPLLAAALLAFCIVPMTGLYAKLQRSHLNDPLTKQLMTSLPAMLQAKDRGDLQAVLELPAAPWPTAPPIRDFDVYQHYLPYVYDRPLGATRWSYGIDEHQSGFGVVQFVASGGGEGLVDRARRYGFDSVLIEKRAYDAAELNRLQGALAAQLAPACRLYEDSMMVLYALNRTPDRRGC